jgi:hypothetical protein
MLAFKILGGSLDVGDGKIYNRGEVVHSEKELDKQFGTRKFQRLDGVATAESTAVVESDFSDLEGMSLAELRKFAEDEEIDLEGATRKEATLAVIRKAMG